jgi:hypothetical protein
VIIKKKYTKMITFNNFKNKNKNFEYNFNEDKNFLIIRKKNQLKLFEKNLDEYYLIFEFKNKLIINNWLRLNDHITKKKKDFSLINLYWKKL